MASVQQSSEKADSAGGLNQPHAAASTDTAACMLDLLLPDTLINILKLLHDSPESIVAFSLTCSQAQQLCSDHLWFDLCRSITDILPGQLRNVDWSPSVWGLDSHRELYIRLLQPYRPLLQQRVWHTTKMPAGQLLVVDAMPPVIVGRSVSYRTLQGDPLSHALFVVRLPRGADGALQKGKARVFCTACQPPDHLSSDEKMNMHMARSGRYNSLCSVRHLTPAQLQYLGLQESCPNAAAAASAGAQDAQDNPCTSTSTSAAQQGAVAAADAASAGGQDTQPQPCTSANTTSSSCTDREAVSGLSLCCTASCGNLYAELVARWRVAQTHTANGIPQPRAPPAAAAPAGPHENNQSSRGSANSSSSSADSDAAEAAAATGSSSSRVLPLPEVAELRITPWDLRWIVEELDIPADWRSHAEYKPFCPTPWLQLAAKQDAAVAGAGTFEAGTGMEAASGQRSSCSRGGCVVMAGTAAAAEGLTGLWKGTYGSHGVEIVQLQLLHAPVGYNFLQQHGMQNGHVGSFSASPTRVLLHSLLHTAPHVVHPSVLQSHSISIQNLAAVHPAVNWEAAAAADHPATGAGAEGANSSATSRQQQQAQQQQGNQHQHLPQVQQLLLVGSKVTGDRNVPAGQVTFAVDLGSRSREGAGRLLQLPPSIQSDVRVNAQGTRELVVKERYSGLAQIADVYFQSPRLLSVELIVFEDRSCMGLLWQHPMDSFSLLYRLEELP